MKAKSKMFRGMMKSWEKLFTEAQEFATGLGPDRVISVSHSADGGDGVVVVWYWDGSPNPKQAHDW